MRPRISEINQERIQKFAGDSFDDKLGTLFTVCSAHKADCKSYRDLAARYANDWVEADSKAVKFMWISVALGILCAGLLIYIFVR